MWILIGRRSRWGSKLKLVYYLGERKIGEGIK
jgi:hypothetical protein